MHTHSKYQIKLEEAKASIFKDLSPDNLLLKAFGKEDEVLFLVSTYDPNFSIFLSVEPDQLVKNESKKMAHILEFFRITLETFYADLQDFSYLIDWEEVTINEEFKYSYRIVRENAFVSLKASELLGDYPLWWLKNPESSSETLCDQYN